MANPKNPNKKSVLAIRGGKPVRTELFPSCRVIGKEEKEAACRVIDSGVLSRYLGCWDPDFMGGPEVQILEKEWAEHFGVKHAIAVNSATSGLISAVGAIGTEPGDEFIVTPWSMSISATAPLFYGGIPVFADIEPEHFCLDPEDVRRKITPRTKAIIAVDLFGQPYDADAINQIAKEHNLIVIEDAAQAPGAKYKGRYAGTLGNIGVYSLNYHKHIHTGEGGVIVTNDDGLADRLRLIRNHAEAVVGDKGNKDLVNMIGYNFRLTELNAAIAREQLKKLEKLNAERQKNCAHVAKRLAKLPGIKPAPTRKGADHVYYFQPFLFDEKVVGVSRKSFLEAVKAELKPSELREQEGVLLNYPYVKPLYMLPIFQKRIAFGKGGYPFNLAGNPLNYAKGLCPNAERLDEKSFFSHQLMRPGSSQKDLDDVCKAFEKVYEHRHELS
ncbi:MAG: DegT/DnrJ/EryC1/StrS family aminotransferase [Minisyncoccia bacterium]|jgi:dTDP-4-amino-4,6-dideoxygalactose transaminase